MSETRLTRSETDSVIAGVCGGLAAYLTLDVIFIRLAFLILGLASGIGLPIYLILWMIMPREGGTSIDSEIIQENLSEMGETASNSFKRFKQPGNSGMLLIIVGVYFLLRQFGFLGSLDGAIVWPMLIIGFGFYMLTRRKRQD